MFHCCNNDVRVNAKVIMSNDVSHCISQAETGSLSRKEGFSSLFSVSPSCRQQHHHGMKTLHILNCRSHAIMPAHNDVQIIHKLQQVFQPCPVCLLRHTVPRGRIYFFPIPSRPFMSRSTLRPSMVSRSGSAVHIGQRNEVRNISPINRYRTGKGYRHRFLPGRHHRQRNRTHPENNESFWFVFVSDG